ncbi:hypothetical protein RintRC_3378 [Richelia intracellularis]|nr:hypothetical protein RintRC_3378 [Richelia intracellularis]
MIEYLWKAAFVFYAQTSTQAQAWVSKRLQIILEGKSSSVAPGMRRSPTLPKLTLQERKPVDTCARYLLNNAKYLKYDDYLKAGLSIATGVIEGACRHLIEDSMDITGARWTMRAPEAVLPWVLYTSVAIGMSIGSFIYNKNINPITWLCTLVVFL